MRGYVLCVCGKNSGDHENGSSGSLCHFVYPSLIMSEDLCLELPCLSCVMLLCLSRFYSTNIVEASNVKRYALKAWEGAAPEVRKAYGAADSFEDHFVNNVPKTIPNLR